MADQASTDGTLLVQIAQWQAVAGIDDALAAIFDKDFDPDTAEPHDDPVRKALMFGETLGTLTKNGLISTELVLDWMWVSGLWDRVGKAALSAREQFGEPKLYENFEALAKAQSG
jgi:hypothetical protein